MTSKQTVELAEALPFLGTDRGMFNHWLKEGVFETEFEETRPGVPRKLNRENCLEVAFFVASFDALSSRHPRALIAARFNAKEWLNRERDGTLGEIWIPDTGFVDASLSISDLAKKIGGGRSGPMLLRDHEAKRLSLVNVAEIVRDIDELFAMWGSDG